ncbi:tryptophan synthase beta subunit-like PLP-dependent enzyme [Syncephalis pseudoplumigaleata]|uniref:Tryptophan synthase beta subunit-like PLP-dependent enzyme n=1 Tax=Syncephalis pseudoplumigaleata TaxID=1712513 RepID=A0A4P9Z5A1_9FUNG|nr:tryptophan synthase beta subunit-like PLP-dependent enzyme [Syncephalis pseudoplumigaleata]|eukprot:RKP27797.1 tryptophan synthase beta subunit-like PLP-dependent enzyme [Syncephalis pseudoplumigaleata]
MLGDTPIATIRLSEAGHVADLLVKLEYRNPTGSIKDRVADWLLNACKRDGRFTTSHPTLVVPTSGNLAIALAVRACECGYRVVAVIPESTSYDRIRLLKAQGVEIIRTPNVRRASDESCFAVARRVAAGIANAIVVDETDTLFSPVDAYRAMSREIIEACAELDAVFIGVESGGALSGLGASLKAHYPQLKVMGVLPEGATFSEQGSHIMQRTWLVEDMGTEFIASPAVQASADAWMHVADQLAYSTARELIRQHGILSGPSGGAVVAAARQYHASSDGHTDHKLLAIINDAAALYPSTLLNDEWLMQHDLAGANLLREIQHQALEKYRGASVEDLQLPAAVTVRDTTPLVDALEQMTEREFSQLPVLDAHRKMIGFVYDADLRAILEGNGATATDPVGAWMHRFTGSSTNGTGGGRRRYQIITPDTPLAELAQFFERHSAAFVTDAQRRWCLGVATKYDLIRFLTGRGQGF